MEQLALQLALVVMSTLPAFLPPEMETDIVCNCRPSSVLARPSAL